MKLVQPYEPLGVLKQVDEEIWIVDGPVIHMQQFGLNVPFPTRMTVIRLSNGDLFVHSPVRPDERLFVAMEKLGRVAHLVSPNKIHYASIGIWSERYPGAICWASPGVRERSQRHQINVVFNADLDEKPPRAWLDEIDQLIFRGSRFMEEVVFFHKQSRTLILADLIENFEPSKLHPVMRWLVKLGGNLDPDGKLPIDLRLTYAGSRELACQSFCRMAGWQPEKIILAHGRWYNTNGSAELRRAFRWLNCKDNQNKWQER